VKAVIILWWCRHCQLFCIVWLTAFGCWAQYMKCAFAGELKFMVLSNRHHCKSLSCCGSVSQRPDLKPGTELSQPIGLHLHVFRTQLQKCMLKIKFFVFVSVL